MKSLRKSIHAPEQALLRGWLVDKRQALNLTQRQLAEKMQVVRSFIGKVEIGERRLDVIEFLDYCQELDANPEEFFSLLKDRRL